jgi:hypothetical protein
MNILMTPRHSTLLASLLMTIGLAGNAAAQEPGPAEASSLRAASGRYELNDGRVLWVQAHSRRATVSLDHQSAEWWVAESADVLVSPDGHQRIKLLRSSNGSVDRVELHTERQR